MRIVKVSYASTMLQQTLCDISAQSLQRLLLLTSCSWPTITHTLSRRGAGWGLRSCVEGAGKLCARYTNATTNVTFDALLRVQAKRKMLSCETKYAMIFEQMNTETPRMTRCGTRCTRDVYEISRKTSQVHRRTNPGTLKDQSKNNEGPINEQHHFPASQLRHEST